METKSAPTSKPDTQLFYDAFKASPIGIAVANLEGQPLFVKPCVLLIPWFQRRGTAVQTLRRFFSARRRCQGLGSFSATTSGSDRKLPTGEALFSTGRFAGLGTVE